MDLRAVNLANLKILADEAGGLHELAEQCGSSYETLQQIVKGYRLPSGNPRMLGNNLKQRLEREMSKPAGWLDQDHTITGLSQAAIDFGKWYDSLDADGKQRAIGARLAISSKAVPDLVVEDTMPITKPNGKRRYKA
jgi:hypothetical protein